MARRLTSSHPTAIKVKEVEDLMYKLGLELMFDSYGHCKINDKQQNITVNYKDVEGGDATEFPSFFETKLIIDE